MNREALSFIYLCLKHTVKFLTGSQTWAGLKELLNEFRYPGWRLPNRGGQ